MNAEHPEPHVVRTLHRRWCALSDEVARMIVNFRICHPTAKLVQQSEFELNYWNESSFIVTGGTFLVRNRAGYVKPCNSMTICYDKCDAHFKEDISRRKSRIIVGRVISEAELEERQLHEH